MKTYRIVKQPQWVLIEEGDWDRPGDIEVGHFELRREAKAAMAPLVEAAESYEAYREIADELNDSAATYHDGVKPGLEMFDEESVRLGGLYAAKNGLSWPPATGDYDRLWERENGYAN
jgi:hypothetical protein